jgi:hypothetical protein
MDYTFLNYCRKNAKSNWNEAESRAYDEIVQHLFQIRLHGNAKARQIDEYDSESYFGNRTLYPGQIYIFSYDADTSTIYDDGHIKFEYFDCVPIVLVTHVEKNIVRGINLNLCNYALRAYIINALHNVDLDFYNRGHLVMAKNKMAPISQNVIKLFINPLTEKSFFDYIKKECNLKNTNVIYRSYAIRNIKDIRMLEVWQHKYIPFLNYTGDLDLEMLKLIWKVTGVDKVHI